MRIAISTDQGLVSAHFGRCQSYTIYEIEGNVIKSQNEIQNPGHQPGFLPRYLSEKGVNVIISGGMGPRAQTLFAQSGIKTISGVQGAVDNVIQQYIKGSLESGEDMCDHNHSGGSSDSDQQITSLPSSEGRICITAQGGNLSAELDPRFGRADFFVFVDPITWETEEIENPYKDLVQGAGIQTAQFIVEKQTATLITGKCGPKALEVFKSADITVVTGARGSVEDLIKKLRLEVK
jgi:predicted Fe-Mo cluster-binding NifX family protein